MLGVVLSQALMMGLLSMFLLGSQRHFLLTGSQQQAQGMARTLAVGAVPGVMTHDASSLQDLVTVVASSPGVDHAMVMNLDGQVLAHSLGMVVGAHLEDAPTQALLAASAVPVELPAGADLIEVGAPLLYQGQHLGWARVALRNSNVAAGAAASTRTALTFLVLASLIGMLLGLWLARHFTNGLHHLLRALERLRTGERGFRLDETRGDELSQLGLHFNAMLADLERQEAETWRRAQELDVERTRLANIIEGTQAGTWEWNVQTGGVLFNRRWAEMLGYQLEELQPLSIQTWQALTHPDDLRDSAQLLARHFAGELPHYECQARLRHKAGHWVWVLDRGQVANWSDDGRPLWMFGTHQDISAQKAVEADLRQATEMAEKAARAKGDFLANMSHEIRTPMNAVIGIAHLLERSPLDADQRQLLGKLQVAGRSLMSLIDDVLDLGKIDAGQMTLENAVFSPQLLLSELHDMFLPQAQYKQLNFELRGEQDLPRQLQGDVVRLRQILSNLVSNALKFTAKGEVLLAVRAEADVGERLWLHAVVVDSGCGIAPEAQARLFLPFSQEDASTTRRFGGTGLGLSIVRRLVTLMGGEVGFSSTPGQGSEFWVRLPLALAAVDLPLPFMEERQQAQAQALLPGPGELLERLPGVHLLVVDDSDINLDVARRLLQAEGATVTTCTNGREAVACLRQEPQLFDAVLMDIQMPEMDGFEATRLIRAELGLAQLPILALTAGVRVEERWRAMAAGMNGFLSKPLDPMLLVSSLRQSVERVRGQTLPVERRLVPATSGALAQAGAADVADAAKPQAWPEIEGIDAEDVRKRLGGERELFLTLLSHLLQEFAWLADEPSAQQTLQQDRETLRAKVHKLRGSSGMLGAKAVYQLASELEIALQTPAPDVPPERLLTQLAQTLDALIHTAQAVLVERSQPGLGSPASGQNFTSQYRLVLEALLALLRAQDLAALTQLHAAQPAVLALGGTELWAKVSQAVELLDFAKAAGELDQALHAFAAPSD